MSASPKRKLQFDTAEIRRLRFSFLMALIMSGIMSMVISLFNIGWVDDILAIWLKAWMLAFLVAFPTITVVVPVVRYLVSFIVAADKHI